MRQTDFDDFYSALTTLQRYYRNSSPLTQGEIADYFSHLRPFDLAVVDEAVERAPIHHPTFFPNWGELYRVCELVATEMRGSLEARADRQKQVFDQMAACEHAIRDVQPEPPGGFIREFHVCASCGHSRPVFSRDPQFARERAYLATAITARDSSSGATRPQADRMLSLGEIAGGESRA